MELRTDTATSSAAKRGRRLLTARHVDGRTRGGKRARKLAAELARGFGTEITEMQRRACEQAGMLAALAEDLAARRLAGQVISFDELLRAEGCAKRAIRAVLAECPPKPRGLPRLTRARWAADEQAKAAAQAVEKAGEATEPTGTKSEPVSATDNTELPDARVE
jgi:hypothetical protein